MATFNQPLGDSARNNFSVGPWNPISGPTHRRHEQVPTREYTSMSALIYFEKLLNERYATGA
jgi:hypothetical protein